MMTHIVPANIFSSNDGPQSSPDAGLYNFRRAIAERVDTTDASDNASHIWKLKLTRTECIASLVEFCIRYPAAESEAFTFVSDLLGISTIDLRKACETQTELSTKKQRFQDAYSSLIDRFEAEFELEELLPPSVAAVLRKSCNRTGTDFVSGLFYLLTTTSTLIGAKVMCHSGVKSTSPIPGNLYFFSCGDSSAYKSRTSKKFIKALDKLRQLMEQYFEEQKKVISKIQ